MDRLYFRPISGFHLTVIIYDREAIFSTCQVIYRKLLLKYTMITNLFVLHLKAIMFLLV